MRLPLAGLILIFITQLQLNSSHAAEAREFGIHQQYLSTRSMGMGNAFTAAVDDHSAILFNPAALARREKGNIRLFLGAGLSENDAFEFADDLDQVSESENAAQIGAYLKTRQGEHFNARAPRIGAFWTRPNWAMAIIPADVTVDLKVVENATPAVQVNAYADTTLAYAYAKNFKFPIAGNEQTLSLGATGKLIHRIQVSQTVIPLDLALGNDVVNEDDAREGLLLDVDLGAMWSPNFKIENWAKYLIPDTVAFTIRNALELDAIARFDVVSEGSLEADANQRVFDLGTLYNLPSFWKFNNNKFALDIRNMGHSNWNFNKGLHIGAEFGWEMFSWWNGFWSVGLNQGYFSAGFGAQLSVFRLELATWGDEVGVASNSQEDRKVMVELSLDF